MSISCVTLTCSDIDWSATGAMISAIFAILLVLIAFIQLRKIANTSKADFAHRFKSDFFNETARHLIVLLEKDLLRYDETSEEFNINLTDFYLATNLCDYFHEIKKDKRHGFSSDEIDDFLLGHFEDLGLFYRKGFLDLKTIYEGFDYYIELVHENKQIGKYIEHCRKPKEGETINDNYDIYANFDYIYDELRYYGTFKKLLDIMKLPFLRLRKKILSQLVAICEHILRINWISELLKK